MIYHRFELTNPPIEPSRAVAQQPRALGVAFVAGLRGSMALTLCACVLTLNAGCRDDSDGAKQPADAGDASSGAFAESSAAPAPTNRVDIPQAVRKNLGVTFAAAEYRPVASTLRVPGRFELIPTARREYLSPLSGRIEPLVEQYQTVRAGDPLYRLRSADWLDLQSRIASIVAKVESMGPIREAHSIHEQSLASKLTIWQERLAQLDALREAGGGVAAQHIEARSNLNGTQAELAEVIEMDAELRSQEQQARAELRAAQARQQLLLALAGCTQPEESQQTASELVVCAIAPGVVESIGFSPGGLATENSLVVSIVNPDQVRFRAVALQSDLHQLRAGLSTTIVPPFTSGSTLTDSPMTGPLSVGLTADADERTVDLVVTPGEVASWARAGVSAQLEIMLAGGSEELAVPLAAVVRDGTATVIFRRDPNDPDKAIRMEADLGIADGRWVVVSSGLREGDEVVVAGAYQLMLATSGTAAKGGHFHSDGTFHEEGH